MATRIAAEHDLPACSELRARWRDRFSALISADQGWCPAGTPVPRLETEELVRAHLLGTSEERWAVVSEDHGTVRGYLLCGSDGERRQMSVICQGPRVAEPADLATVGSELLSFALGERARRGLVRAEAFVHGPTVEIGPLAALYRQCGFRTPSSDPRLEMIRPRSLPLAEGRPVSLRTAPEVGLDAFLEADAAVRGCSVNEARENLAFSQRMWIVDPAVDWMVAHEKGDLVGVVETAVTKQGVGVIDHLEVREAYRGRGYGSALLAQALSRFRSRSEFVWLDTDRDCVAARRLYERAGFAVHHEHGTLSAEVLA